eukprot:Blabericola_migrator_1__27@NODE_1007_length_5718_cov_113_774022_g229_i2_p4_GENE_NODE_1007_length_5718_cov_113_774022_g229_i2NODE_1007_length_5718_cov_113_774022_g229_i2_p4_ORF_typecomplete_len168_score15_59GLTT/PF01744_20/0_0014_NODE_1007_length_5718_cov_113_774022_g229_i28601363
MPGSILSPLVFKRLVEGVGDTRRPLELLELAILVHAGVHISRDFDLMPSNFFEASGFLGGLASEGLASKGLASEGLASKGLAASASGTSPPSSFLPCVAWSLDLLGAALRPFRVLAVAVEGSFRVTVGDKVLRLLVCVLDDVVSEGRGEAPLVRSPLVDPEAVSPLR